MSTVDEIELAAWMDRRRQQLETDDSPAGKSQSAVRRHNAFLNSYAPQDESLYD